MCSTANGTVDTRTECCLAMGHAFPVVWQRRKPPREEQRKSCLSLPLDTHPSTVLDPRPSVDCGTWRCSTIPLAVVCSPRALHHSPTQSGTIGLFCHNQWSLRIRAEPRGVIHLLPDRCDRLLTGSRLHSTEKQVCIQSAVFFPFWLCTWKLNCRMVAWISLCYDCLAGSRLHPQKNTRQPASLRSSANHKSVWLSLLALGLTHQDWKNFFQSTGHWLCAPFPPTS